MALNSRTLTAALCLSAAALLAGCSSSSDAAQVPSSAPHTTRTAVHTPSVAHSPPGPTAQPVPSSPASMAGQSATSAPETSAVPTPRTSARLNYATTITAPPTPIGAAGISQPTPTETMSMVIPSQMARAPFHAITAPTSMATRTVLQSDPVQLAAVFVTLVESAASTDSMAYNATQRAAPYATAVLHSQLAAAPSSPPPAGSVQVTIRSAAIVSAAAGSLTVAVIFDELTVVSPSINFNRAGMLTRLCTMTRGADGKWLVSAYRHGAN